MVFTITFVHFAVRETNPFVQHDALSQGWRAICRRVVATMARFLVLLSVLWRTVHLGLLSLLLALSTLTFGVYVQVCHCGVPPPLHCHR